MIHLLFVISYFATSLLYLCITNHFVINYNFRKYLIDFLFQYKLCNKVNLTYVNHDVKETGNHYALLLKLRL